MPKAAESKKPEGVLLDIDSELDYWRQTMPESEFRAMSMSFTRFIPTIKFGYDCYLMYHQQPLAEILPTLRDRYRDRVPVSDQLDWRWADQIVRHAWGRMVAS